VREAIVCLLALPASPALPALRCCCCCCFLACVRALVGHGIGTGICQGSVDQEADCWYWSIATCAVLLYEFIVTLCHWGCQPGRTENEKQNWTKQSAHIYVRVGTGTR
jgi:hypothetical protein